MSDERRQTSDQFWDERSKHVGRSMRPHEDPQCQCAPCREFDAERDRPETDVWLEPMIVGIARERHLQAILGLSGDFAFNTDGDDGWRPCGWSEDACPLDYFV